VFGQVSVEAVDVGVVEVGHGASLALDAANFDGTTATKSGSHRGPARCVRAMRRPLPATESAAERPIPNASIVVL
jgi:hypothetical protein